MQFYAHMAEKPRRCGKTECSGKSCIQNLKGKLELKIVEKEGKRNANT